MEIFLFWEDGNAVFQFLRIGKQLSQTAKEFTYRKTDRNSGKGEVYFSTIQYEPIKVTFLLPRSDCKFPPLATSNKLREFGVKSRKHLLPDKFEYSHYPFSWQCMDVLARTYILTTGGSLRGNSIYSFVLRFVKVSGGLRRRWLCIMILHSKECRCWKETVETQPSCTMTIQFRRVSLGVLRIPRRSRFFMKTFVLPWHLNLVLAI